MQPGTKVIKRSYKEHQDSSDEPAVKQPKSKQREFDFSKHPKRKIAVKFYYYGWEYDGLVQQDNTKNTVEEKLLEALVKTRLIESMCLKSCDFSRCGRTDKGVSAQEQVAAFVVRSSDPSGEHVFWPEGTLESVMQGYKGKEELNYVKLLNCALPKNIGVVAWSPVARNFNARFDCVSRAYKYHIPRANLNVEAMQIACKYLIGEHDFRNFAQIDMNEKRVTASYVRTLHNASIRALNGCANNDKKEEALTFQNSFGMLELMIEGSGFLWHQIRLIVGILLTVGQGLEKPEIVLELLDVKKNPSRPQYEMAVGSPLCLSRCQYDKVDWRIDQESLKKKFAHLQGNWADYVTRSMHLTNFMRAIASDPNIQPLDFSRGLIEFTQVFPSKRKYIPILERPKCDSLEMRKEKLEQKKSRNKKSDNPDSSSKTTEIANNSLPSTSSVNPTTESLSANPPSLIPNGENSNAHPEPIIPDPPQPPALPTSDISTTVGNSGGNVTKTKQSEDRLSSTRKSPFKDILDCIHSGDDTMDTSLPPPLPDKPGPSTSSTVSYSDTPSTSTVVPVQPTKCSVFMRMGLDTSLIKLEPHFDYHLDPEKLMAKDLEELSKLKEEEELLRADMESSVSNNLANEAELICLSSDGEMSPTKSPPREMRKEKLEPADSDSDIVCLD